jgi:lipid kinase YegS
MEIGKSHEAPMRVVLNGKAAADETIRAAILELRELGHKVDVRVTWEARDAELFAHEAARAGYRAVIAAGGDGTLNEAVNGLLCESEAHCGCGLGVLPFGTANDFAVGCGIPPEPKAALDLVVSSKPTLIDVGQVNGRLFLNCATGGYGAQVTAETSPEMKKLLGGFAYFVTGLASMTSLSPRAISLAAPGLNWQGNVLGLVVANGRQSGGGLQVAPSSLLNDGLLDLLVIPESPLVDLLALIGELSRLGGDQSEYARLIHQQVPWVDVAAPEGLHLNVDGEPMQGDRFRFEVVSRRLPCYLPPTAPVLAPDPST